MKAALIDATGCIGSHILTELHEHGHEVTALLRDAAQADIAKARGATPVMIDLYDRRAVTSLLADAYGAIHNASPGDAISAGLDSALLDQGTATARARAELGWYPSHPSLADEFRHGSYRK